MIIKNHLIGVFLVILLVQCKKDKEQPIKIETGEISLITISSATGGGFVFLPDERQILLRGICWDTTPQPTLEGSHSTDGKGNGHFNSVLSDLKPDTEYFVRAYAKTESQIFYGSWKSFRTSNGHPFGGGFTVDSVFHNRAFLKFRASNPYHNTMVFFGLFEAGTSEMTGRKLENPETFSEKNLYHYKIYTKLKPQTSYTVRAYLSNGSSYTDSVQTIFTTKEKFEFQSVIRVDSLTYSEAFLSFTVVNQNFPTQSEIGICYGMEPNPTVEDKVQIGQLNNDTYTAAIQNLIEYRFYARIYVKYPYGEDYGHEIEFTPLPYPMTQIYDVDGNIYNVIRIGSKLWLRENLKTTRFNDTQPIPLVTNSVTWYYGLLTPAFCWYDNNINENKDTYGALYNWYAVNSNKLCPEGWRVPSNEEWDEMAGHLWGNDVAGGKMKSTGTIENGTGLWSWPNEGATNASGFSAVPAGGRFALGEFLDKGDKAFFWSTTISHISSVWIRSLDYRRKALDKDICDYNKRYGLSVRCIKDAF